jgi:hypothetical protein
MQIEKIEDKTGFYLVDGVEVDVFKLAADLTEQERFQYMPGKSEQEHHSLIVLGACAGLVQRATAT